MAWVAPWVDVSPLGRSRGGTPAGERARQRTGRRKPLYPWREPHPLVRWLVKQRLPAFRFSYVPGASFKDLSSFVIAGLDPAIHAAARLPLSLCRGGDERVGCLTLRLAELGRLAPRERDRVFTSPHTREKESHCPLPRKTTYRFLPYSVHHSAEERGEALDLNQRRAKDF